MLKIDRLNLWIGIVLLMFALTSRLNIILVMVVIFIGAFFIATSIQND